MLLRCPLERTKSPSSSAASRMREARSGLTGVPLLPLELPQGLVEWPEVQTLDDLADPASLVPGGVELRLYARVDLPQQLHGPAERADQLLVGHGAQRVGEPLELPGLLLELSEIRRLPTLHRFGLYIIAPPGSARRTAEGGAEYRDEQERDRERQQGPDDEAVPGPEQQKGGDP